MCVMLCLIFQIYVLFGPLSLTYVYKLWVPSSDLLAADFYAVPFVCGFSLMSSQSDPPSSPRDNSFSLNPALDSSPMPCPTVHHSVAPSPCSPPHLSAPPTFSSFSEALRFGVEDNHSNAFPLANCPLALSHQLPSSDAPF